MKLLGFRIQGYRSIKDSKWQNLSLDNITCLIGQNEAGKTAILDALNSFSNSIISQESIRSDEVAPEVSCSFSISWEEIRGFFPEEVFPRGLAKIIKDRKRINIKRSWNLSDLKSNITLEEKDIIELFTNTEEQIIGDANETEQIVKTKNEESNQENSESNNVEKLEKADINKKSISLGDFTKGLLLNIPKFEKFEDFACLLPNKIDIKDLKENNSSVEGFKGAINLLAIAGLDLKELELKTLRIRDNKIAKLNKEVTADFREFWRQKIGKSNQISLEIELKHHDASVEGKAGEPYFAFWIKDGNEKLYPKQRSKGVRWFTSFYLQLKVFSLDWNKSKIIFLIDEPGGSLHARAQEDVIKVFEDIKDKTQILYTTHSPYLIKMDSIYRILAVQRADALDEKSETNILNAHQLGSSSKDTLSPIYTAIGADFSQQQVIKKTRNILLEEISAYYYISAFWVMSNLSDEINLIPATGTSNILQLANLFLGWGLKFGVVVDDEKSGRVVYNRLKHNLFLDDEENAKKFLMKTKGHQGIEDIFSVLDFKKFILDENNDSDIDKNSDYMKGKPKTIFSLKFFLKVKNGEIKLENFDKSTQENIKELVKNILFILTNVN